MRRLAFGGPLELQPRWNLLRRGVFFVVFHTVQISYKKITQKNEIYSKKSRVITMYVAEQPLTDIRTPQVRLGRENLHILTIFTVICYQ